MISQTYTRHLDTFDETAMLVKWMLEEVATLMLMPVVSPTLLALAISAESAPQFRHISKPFRRRRGSGVHYSLLTCFTGTAMS